MVDGEVKCDDGVATLGVGQREGRLARALGVEVAVHPTQAVADILDISPGAGVLDSEVEGDDGVAALGVGGVPSVVTTRSVSVAVPVEAVTSEGGGVTGVAVVDGQMQCDDRVATRDVGECMRRGNSGSLSISVTIPSEAVASEGGSVTGVAVADGQVQSHHGVATVGGSEGLDVVV